MSWQILTLLSVITYSFSVILQRILVREDARDPIAFAIVFQCGVGIMIGIFGFLTQDMRLPDFRPIWMNFLSMAVLYSIGNILLFKALQKIEASKFTIIFSSRSLFSVFASSFFLAETLMTYQWLGAICIFAGIYLVTGKINRINFSKFDFFALLAALAFGLATTNDRVLLQSFHLYPYACLGFLLPAVFISSFYPRSFLHMRIYFHKKVLWKIVLLCAVFAAGSLLFFAALQKAPNSSQVATVNVTSVIVIVLLSIVFLKERANWAKKILGAIVSFVGLLLVS